MSQERTRTLFGTDGIRAAAGQYPLDPATIYAVGLALGHSLPRNGVKPRVLLGRDTRESGPWIAATLAAGLREAGAAVESAGVITTPAVAFLVRSHGFAAGVETVSAGEKGDGRSGHNAGAFNACVRPPQAGGQSGGDPGAGLTRIAAENHPGGRCGLAQGVAEGQADGEDGGGVERIFAGDAADAVGAEEFACGWCDRCCGHRLHLRF